MATEAETILALERAALARWNRGDPKGYLEISSPEATYFDPMIDERIDGYPALEKHLLPVAGKIFTDRHELLNPHVTVASELGILTYNLVTYVGESVNSRWNVTEVFRKSGGEWKIVHSHFSITKPA